MQGKVARHDHSIHCSQHIKDTATLPGHHAVQANHTGTKTPGACCQLTADKALPTPLPTAPAVNTFRLGCRPHCKSKRLCAQAQERQIKRLNPWCPGTHENATRHAAHAQCTNTSLALTKQMYSRAAMERQMCSFLKQGDQARDGVSTQAHAAWFCCATPSLSMCSRSAVSQPSPQEHPACMKPRGDLQASKAIETLSGHM